MQTKTLIIVIYNDRYGNGDNTSNEVILESEKDFDRWLRERNKQRLSEGEMEESANEFTLQYINLVQYYHH
jgi:hypothetical protein